MATAGWSSLPDDLVRRIADSFLATNDVDCYMDLRAICRSWRSATDDPKDNRRDSPFRPRQWIILDDVQNGTRHTLVNTATGRFLHKELPRLRDYYIVATTLGGFFVLADRSPPHAARVFNPLTGYIIRFTAPMPVEVEVAAAVHIDSSSPVLTLFCDSCRKIHTTVPNNFVARDYERSVSSYNFFRRAVAGAMDGRWRELIGTDGILDKIRDALTVLNVGLCKLFFSDPLETGAAHDFRCFLMEFGGQPLIIVINLQLQRPVQVFKFEAGSDVRVPVKSIDNHAIFVGPQRCLAVDADVFPSVEANCVYYTEHLGSSACIRKCNINDGKTERISSEAFDFVKQDKRFVLVADRPHTIIQLLSSYTINIRSSELALQKITQGGRR